METNTFKTLLSLSRSRFLAAGVG